MKSLTKQDIHNRFNNSNYKYSVEVIDLKKPVIQKNIKFNKMLKIIIPGEPLIDGRVRFLERNDGSIGTYNPHKAQLMKVYKYIYDDDPILHGLCILGPMRIDLYIYNQIPKSWMKHLSKKDLIDLETGNFVAPAKPDIDNGMKIHYDVMQDLQYQNILRDECVVAGNTEKYFVKDVKDQRVVLEIYYNDKIPEWYKENVYNSSDYLRYTLSMKYKFINNISDENWQKHFYQTIASFYKRTKKNPLTSVKYVLSKYKKNDLDLILYEKTSELAIEKILNMVEAIIIELKLQKK